MRGTGTSLVAAIVLALLASACLAAGLIDRRVVRAQQEFAAQRYARADESLDSVERYLEYGRWIPWIRNGLLNDVRIQRAAMRYWSGQYQTGLSQVALSHSQACRPTASTCS